MQAALQSIEQNNRELRAITALNENKRQQLLSENSLPDPQVDGYFLPFGEHTPGDYYEFEISQSIEFPTVYSTRKKWVDAQALESELKLNARRQEILLQSEQLFIDLIHLRKRTALEQERYEQAKKIAEQVKVLHQKGQIGLLELNKANIAWMQVQFKVQHLENEESGLILSLKNMNGGDELIFTSTEYEGDLLLAEKVVLWQEMLTQDPTLRQLAQRQTVAVQGVKIAKNQGLPGLKAGYNYQGIPGSNYSGIYAGLTIPLWSNRHNVKAARSDLAYQEAYTTVETAQALTAFEKSYNSFQLLFSEYKEYRRTMNGLNSEALLLKAYELGEISFLEYHMELQFFRAAIDTMLLRERDMHQLKAYLQRHQL